MATVRVLAGDIPPGKYSLITHFGTDIMVRGFGEALDLNQFRARFSLLDAQEFKTVGGTVALGTAGVLIAGPLGAIGGMLLSGRKNICTFQCVLGDGRTFLGETDGVTWKYLLTVNFRSETAPKSPATVDITPSDTEAPGSHSGGGAPEPESAPLAIAMAEDKEERSEGTPPWQAVAQTKLTPEESRVALKNMAWSVVGLMVVLGVLAFVNKVVIGATKRDTAIQYVDEQGNPISKERAEAWLKARDEHHRKWNENWSKASARRETKSQGEIIRDGFYAAQVLRCANMNDVELSLNEGLCREATRRVDKALGP